MYGAPSAYSCLIGMVSPEGIDLEQENEAFLLFAEKVTVRGLCDGHLACLVKNVLVVSTRTGQRNSKLSYEYNRVNFL